MRGDSHRRARGLCARLPGVCPHVICHPVFLHGPFLLQTCPPGGPGILHRGNIGDKGAAGKGRHGAGARGEGGRLGRASAASALTGPRGRRAGQTSALGNGRPGD